MFKSITALLTFVVALGYENALASTSPGCSPLLDYRIKALAEERSEHLCETYRNKVVLIVNTASRCAYTPQYDGLEALYDKYRDRGLVVLGFPSNDFGAQKPGTEKVIQDFCRLTYNVKFPMFEKTRAAEHVADPLYRGLAEAAGGKYPRWNFHKYLLDREGRLQGSFPSSVRPDDVRLVDAIEQLL